MPILSQSHINQVPIHCHSYQSYANVVPFLCKFIANPLPMQYQSTAMWCQSSANMVSIWSPSKTNGLTISHTCQSITNLLIQCKSWFNLPIQYKYTTHPPIHCQSANSKEILCQSVNLKSIHPQSAYSKPLSQSNSNQPILDQNANPISIPKQSAILS